MDMFPSVNTKFERADYFLTQLINEKVGIQPWRAYLEAFFFELVSAKDIFLQELNEKYNLGLKKDEATRLDLLKRCLECKGHIDAVEVLKRLEKELSDKNSWLWRLNNYRNSATHRELVHIGYEAGNSDHTEVYLFKDPEDSTQGNAEFEVVSYCQQSLKKLREFLERLLSDIFKVPSA